RVQQKLTERRDRTTPRVGGGTYIFSGLLQCGHCGWPMHGFRDTRKSRGGVARLLHRYVCGNYNLHGAGERGCKCNVVREDHVMTALVQTMRQEFLKPANLAALTAEIRRQEEAERDGRVKPTATVERQIAELRQRI